MKINLRTKAEPECNMKETESARNGKILALTELFDIKKIKV